MPNEISTTGITTASQAELYAELATAFRAIFGADINLESNTPDGQILNIFIQSVLDVEDLVTQVFNSFDPDLAIGVVLDQRVAINGIQRQAGTYTTTNIDVVVAQSVNIYGIDQSDQPIYTVSDLSGNQWELLETELGLSVGTHTLVFRAANPGQVLTVPNTITIPVTIVLGVTSVNNPEIYSTLGVDEESDAALRVRRQKSVSIQSQGYFKGLLGALENIPGITSASVYENDTGSTDSNGIPGHSIWVIVAGTPSLPLTVAYNAATTYNYGSIASSAGVNYISVANDNTGNLVSDTDFWQVYNPIAEAIYNYRNAGCGMYNSGDSDAESYTITQIDGSPFTVYWDGVVQVNPFIKMQTGSLNQINPPNVAAIQEYLTANFLPGVGEEMNINEVSTLSQIADPNVLVLFSSGYGFSLTSGGSYTFTLTPNALNKQFVIESANIIVLPIVLSCDNGTPVFGTNGVLTNITVSIENGGEEIQFSAVGGYSTFTYSVVGAGSINSSTGLYTSNTVGTDTVTVTDTQGNTMTATVSVI